MMATLSPAFFCDPTSAQRAWGREGALCLLATEGMPPTVAAFSHKLQELTLTVSRDSTAPFQVYKCKRSKLSAAKIVGYIKARAITISHLLYLCFIHFVLQWNLEIIMDTIGSVLIRGVK